MSVQMNMTRSGLMGYGELCPGCEERFVRDGALCVGCRQRDMDLESRWAAYASERDAAAWDLAGARVVRSTVPFVRRVPVQTRGEWMVELAVFGVVAVGAVMSAMWLWQVLGAVGHAAIAFLKGVV